MTREKRTGIPPVPDNFVELLNQWQQNTLQRIESFGWRVKFIRRPLFQDITIVVTNPTGDQIGTLEQDGEVSVHPIADFRR
ncbi:MAG: hypothetical protein KUF72_18870 [Candidatus Thiodiazotropha sp. (ex Ctena orbiculata)]|nr:hypothetical protein [Candidatus Thiodiazotropha taylori]